MKVSRAVRCVAMGMLCAAASALASESATSATQASTGAAVNGAVRRGSLATGHEAASVRGGASGAGNRSLEQEMFDLINRDRSGPAVREETHGRAAPLQWDERLAAVARAHSQDMITRRFYAHVNPDGWSPVERVTAAGIHWEAVAENIAIYSSVAGAEREFMNEPRFEENHRGNILNPVYTKVGVGIVQAPDGRYYITQEFVASPVERRAESASATASAPAQATGR